MFGRLSQPWVVVLAAILMGTGATAADPAGSPEMTNEASPPPDGWSLVWSDEFEGPAGTPPDPATWGYDLGDGSAVGLPGWGNQERQSYTDDPRNAALDGAGHLVITVRRADPPGDCYYGPCEYTSARLLTKGRLELEHGRIEARIQVPEGVGLWPAFWMLGVGIDDVGWPATGEIDVMEHVGRRPTEILGTLHGPGYSGSSGVTASRDLGAPVAATWHTYAIEWDPGRIVWLLDGEPYHRVTPADVAPAAWPFEAPFFLLLNVAVGGAFGGPVAPDTVFPASMLVDHVRWYRRTP